MIGRFSVVDTPPLLSPAKPMWKCSLHQVLKSIQVATSTGSHCALTELDVHHSNTSDNTQCTCSFLSQP